MTTGYRTCTRCHPERGDRGPWRSNARRLPSGTERAGREPGTAGSTVAGPAQGRATATGANQDTAVAILINRNPADPNDARAGIFVGSAYDNGNVPRREQEAIVDQELIPPLRQGDVYGSVTGGLDRLERSIRIGPPRDRFEEWASDAGSSWFPLGGRRCVAGRTRHRPRALQAPADDHASGSATDDGPTGRSWPRAGPQPSAIPAMLLDLAARDAVDIEPESDGGMFSKPTVRLRLIDHGPVRDEVEVALWTAMEKRADNGVVSSNSLTKVAGHSKDVRKIIERQMRDAGWIDAGAARNKAGLLVVGILGVLLTLFSLVVAIAGGVWLPIVSLVASAAVAVIAFGLYIAYSALSRTGQEAAIPWRAYRQGLERAAKDVALPLDLDAVLADTVAMNLASAMDDRLKAAQVAGQVPRVLMARANSDRPVTSWITSSSIVTMTGGSSSGSGTVSGGGVGGGGGAAGST